MVPPDYVAYIIGWNQNLVTTGGNDFDPLEATWVYANVGGAFDFTDWGFVFRTRKAWQGTIYVDNIVFTP